MNELKNVAINIDITPSEIGYNNTNVEKMLNDTKRFLDEKRRQVEAFKRSQQKDKIRETYMEMGDRCYETGSMHKAQDSYRMCAAYSQSVEDVVSIGIKLGTTCIHNKDYDFGIKYVNDAMTKNNENPVSVNITHLLNSI
jgi:thiamine pyrophosphate-dependent acetolactate synthase large subunit-like protein